MIDAHFTGYARTNRARGPHCFSIRVADWDAKSVSY